MPFLHLNKQISFDNSPLNEKEVETLYNHLDELVDKIANERQLYRNEITDSKLIHIRSIGKDHHLLKRAKELLKLHQLDGYTVKQVLSFIRGVNLSYKKGENPSIDDRIKLSYINQYLNILTNRIKGGSFGTVIGFVSNNINFKKVFRVVLIMLLVFVLLQIFSSLTFKEFQLKIFNKNRAIVSSIIALMIGIIYAQYKHYI